MLPVVAGKYPLFCEPFKTSSSSPPTGTSNPIVYTSTPPFITSPASYLVGIPLFPAMNVSRLLLPVQFLENEYRV